jgi:hypothetical protein
MYRGVPTHHAFLREVLRDVLHGDDLADAEVHDLHELAAVAFGHEDDVRRLEVTVHDAARVRLPETARDLPNQEEHLGRR